MKTLTKVVAFFVFTTSIVFAALENKIDGEFITLSGKVTETSPHAFTVKTDEKNKTIKVEMDDYDSWTADGFKLVKGDQVVVTGRVDKNFFAKNTVEAGSVYVKNIDTYFFANSADEEGDLYITPAYSYVGALPEGALVDLQGKVTNIQGREMTVDTGFRKVKVNTDDLGYNPLDKIGTTKIEVGDRVRVSGKVEDNLFESKKVSANYVTELPKKI